MFERPNPLRTRLRIRLRRRRPLGRLARLDQRLLVALRTHGHSEGTEQVAGALGRFGEWGLGWIAIGAVGAGLDRDRRRAWWSASTIGPAAVAINYAVKVAVGRERPRVEDRARLARASSRLSFPSAHATSSLAAATAMGRIAPRARAPLYSLALAICLGRPFLGMHYPSDVVAGMIVGREIGRRWPLPGVQGQPAAADGWAR